MGGIAAEPLGLKKVLAHTAVVWQPEVYTAVTKHHLDSLVTTALSRIAVLDESKLERPPNAKLRS